MTTLPQTTSMRLPTHVPGGALAQPMTPMPVAAAGGQMTGADAWRVIRANLWIIIASVIVAGIGGYFLNMYLAANYPKFTSTGLIQVNPNPIVNLLKQDQQLLPDRNTVELEQRSQAQLLKHERTFSDLLSRVDNAVRETSWFRQFKGDTKKAKADLMDHLSVSPITDTKLIAVSFSDPDPASCRTVVYELVEQHIRNQSDAIRTQTINRVNTLGQLRQRYEGRRNDLSNELRDKAARLSIDGMGIPGHLNAKEQELADLIRTQLEYQNVANMARNSYESVQAQLQRGEDPAEVDEVLNRDQQIYTLRQMVDGLDASLAEMGKLGPTHPRVVEMQARRDTFKKKLDDARAELGARTRANYLDKLRSSAALSQQQLDAVTGRINEIKKELSTLTNDMALYLTKKDEEQAVREVLKQIDDQMYAMSQNTSRAEQNVVSWSNQPEQPDQPSFPKLPVTMALAVMLGLGLSLGVAFLREMMDTTVRSPRDIARVGQMNVLGVVADAADDPEASGSRLELAIFESPHSMLAEQFRQIRARLAHATSMETTRSIVVTSPSPQDGKTTVAANLAAGLALNGRRVLLVDANFRRPSVGKVFAVADAGGGFADALVNSANFAASVQETAVPNLLVMNAGKRPDNATELLESQLLASFIERALEEFDQVIFDSGPILLVSETVALASRVDGVISVVRAQANSRGLLQRMRETLRQVRAEHLGVVLNGVRSQGGGYYGRAIKAYYDYQQV